MIRFSLTKSFLQYWYKLRPFLILEALCCLRSDHNDLRGLSNGHCLNLKLPNFLPDLNLGDLKLARRKSYRSILQEQLQSSVLSLCNECLTQRKVPNAWKQAEVVIIKKEEDKETTKLRKTAMQKIGKAQNGKTEI